MKKAIIACAAALILLVFAAVILFDSAGIGGKSTPIDIKIEEGAGGAAIAGILKDTGIITSETAFKIYTRLGGSHIFQKGLHRFNSSMSYGEIINELERIPDAEITVTIPEGYEFRQIVDTLENANLINRDIFMREAEEGSFEYDFVAQIPTRKNRLEGYLFPDTYSFSGNESEHEIIDTMLANFQHIVIPVYTQSGSSRSLDEIVNLASIIEREAANDDERGKVASVFINRLNTGMRLESCATVQYILQERKAILSNSDTQIDSPYNTYINTGLPVGPISSPGLNSIEAALYPENTDYLYFQAVSDGSSSVFSSTFDEHLKKQAEIQGEG